jgi:hypothetical protein
VAVVDHSCCDTRMIGEGGHGLVSDTTATLLLGLHGVAVAAAEVDEDGTAMLTLITACEDARCHPGCGCGRHARFGW